MRRFGDKIQPDIRYIDRPGAYAVLERGGRILLTHQAHPRPEFQLPGGGVEAGETPIRALHREVMEETGWRVDIRARLGCYQRYTFMVEYNLWARKICHVFACRPTRQVSQDLEEHHENHWVAVDQAMQFISNPGDQTFLRQHLRRLG